MSIRTIRILLALVTIATALAPNPAAGTAHASAALVVQLLILAVSITAQILLAPKTRNPLADGNPSTASTRGSYVTLLIGRHRIAPVIAYVGERTSNANSGISSGKRGGGGGGINYEEIGWHLICVGPAIRLRRIWSGGSVIFDGTITPSTNPSGTSVIVNNDGTFTIYWGERDQPVSTGLAQLLAGKAGAAFPISSRFGGIMSLLWDKRILGNFPQWQIHEYEVDVVPFSELKGSSAWTPSELFDGPAVPIFGVEGYGASFLSGVPFRVATGAPSNGNIADRFPTGLVVRLEGAAATTWYGVTPAYVDVVLAAFNPITSLTDVILSERQTLQTVLNKVTPVPNPATLVPCVFGHRGGPNLVHCLWQILFAPWPWGAAADRGEYHMPSFEHAAQVVEDEGLIGSVVAREGTTAREAVAKILQDLGAFISYDPRLGLNVLRLIRPPTEAVPSIPIEMQLPPAQEVERLHGGQESNRTTYSFMDAEHNYRAMTFVFGQDGIARYGQVQRGNTVEIYSTVDFPTAAIIAARRSQEDTLRAAVLVRACRDASLLVPGDPLTADGEGHSLRIVAVKPDTLTSQHEVKCRVDSYALAAIDTARLPADVGPAAAPIEPQMDLAVAVVELPRYLSDGRMAVAIGRVRATAQVAGALIWISTDDVTYKQVAQMRGSHTGGTLVDALPASAPARIESDDLPVAIAPVGPDDDVADVWQDLSGNDAAWRLGQQVALIGDEILFVRAVTAGGSPTTLTLEGVLRGRYATAKGDHAADAPIVVARSDELVIVRDVLLAPGATLYVKTQPTTGAQAVNLADVVPVELALQGLAFKPLPPANLRTQNRRGIYRSGDPVSLRWSYRTSQAFTGAGQMGFGQPTGITPPEGSAVLRFYEPGSPNVLKRSVVIDDGATTYEYLNADLAADFGGEPASLLVTLEYVDGGYRSETIELTVSQA